MADKPMSDYYHLHPEAYHEATFHIDPSSFLLPLTGRLPPGALVLDVGCGSGRDLLWLRHRGFRVLGLERSPGLARLARKNANCRVLEAYFAAFDFASLSADAILFVGAFVHAPHRELPALVRADVSQSQEVPGRSQPTIQIPVVDGP